MSNEIEPEYESRLANDIASRMTLGVFIYPFLWLIVGLGSQLHQKAPNLFWGCTAFFGLLAALRIFHLSILKNVSPTQINTWFLQMLCLLLANALIWGSLFAYSFTSGNVQFTLLMTFSTAGVVLGGVHNLAARPAFANSFILTICTPAFLTFLFYLKNWPELCLLLIYAGYSFNMVRSIKREYWHSLNNEFKLKQLSQTDELTQLHNRRYFNEKLSELCRLAAREPMVLTVLLIDCDYFKKVNDNYGHDIGDLCLQHISIILRTQLPRHTDVKARYGGEEFSIILPGTSLDGAKLVADRIRAMVEYTPFKTGSSEINLTLSIGAVSRSLDSYNDDIPAELFKQADKALYQAKENGRNQCVHLNFDDNKQAYI